MARVVLRAEEGMYLGTAGCDGHVWSGIERLMFPYTSDDEREDVEEEDDEVKGPEGRVADLNIVCGRYARQ